MKINKEKITAFYRLTKILNQKLGEIPILYGSLGLNKVMGEFCKSEDIDILIEDKYIHKDWKKFKKFMIKKGYTIYNESEHDFEKEGIVFGFAGKKDIKKFAKIDLRSTTLLEEAGAKFRLLSAIQFLQVYRLMTRDNYRVEKRGKADNEKIKRIKEFLYKSAIPDKYSFDKRYSNNDFTFKYDKEILKDILKYKKSGKILDLGCGQGGLALDLVQKGFEVTGVDISKTAIEKIKEEAKKRNVQINAVVGDLEEYEIDGTYDVILVLGVLQFLGKKGKEYIEKIQRHTKKGGINIIDAFRNRWLPKDKLDGLYSKWEIIEKEEYNDNEENEMVWVVSRKN